MQIQMSEWAGSRNRDAKGGNNLSCGCGRDHPGKQPRGRESQGQALEEHPHVGKGTWGVMSAQEEGGGGKRGSTKSKRSSHYSPQGSRDFKEGWVTESKATETFGKCAGEKDTGDNDFES